MDKECVKVKLDRDLMSKKLNLCEFKMDFIDNGEIDEFLLFVRNFNMTLEAPGKLVAGAIIQ